MTAITLAAFAMEAFLNLLGEQTFAAKYGEKQGLKRWNLFEQRLSAEAKIALLVEMNDINISMSAEPYSLVSSLFKYRNQIAHGKTWRSGEIEFWALEASDFESVKQLTPPWFRNATLPQTQRWVRAVEDVASELLEKTGHLRGLRISDTTWSEST